MIDKRRHVAARWILGTSLVLLGCPGPQPRAGSGPRPCSTSADCESTDWCEPGTAGGTCVPRKPDGESCGDDAECVNGHCPVADLVCCNQACSGACESCTALRPAGTCEAVPSGTGVGSQCLPGVCDAAQTCAIGSCVWAKRYGDAAEQELRAIAVNASGDAVLTGYFDGAVDFGDAQSPHTSAGGREMFLAKVFASGNPLWSLAFGGPGDQLGMAVALDNSGNIYLAGFFESGLQFGGQLLTTSGVSDRDIFVVKFDPSGVPLWSKSFGDTAEQAATGIAVDGGGNVVLIGNFFGSVDFGGGALTSSGDYDVFVVKLDTAGNHLWSKGFGDGALQQAVGVAVNGSGDIFVAGSVRGTINFGGGNLVATGTQAAFLVKLDSGGNHLWSHQFGVVGVQTANSVAVDSSGNAIITGYLAGTANFGGSDLTTIGAGDSDAFVAQFDSAGNHLWSKDFGDAGPQIGRVVATDQARNILLTGEFGGTVNFGGADLTTSAGSDYDVYVAKLDTAGTHLWSKRFGDSATQIPQTLAIDGSGDVLVGGQIDGSPDFCGTTLACEGAGDLFVAKLER